MELSIKEKRKVAPQTRSVNTLNSTDCRHKSSILNPRPKTLNSELPSRQGLKMGKTCMIVSIKCRGPQCRLQYSIFLGGAPSSTLIYGNPLPVARFILQISIKFCIFSI